MSRTATCLSADCGGQIDYIDAPTGGWWAHQNHPADHHDAVPSAADSQPIMTGGLMRCCTLTLSQTPGATEEPTSRDCSYCHHPMVYDGGVWGRDWSEIERRKMR